jgi:translation initiation factor 2A
MATPLQFAYRTQKAIGVFDAAPVYEALLGFVKPEGNLRCCAYSPCGRYFAYASNDGVVVVDASAGHVLTSLSLAAVYELGFSPRGTYLITFERPSKDDNGDATKNLKIWRTVEDLAEGVEKQPMGQFVQKSWTGWNLQYTADEKYCARNVTNEVQFYNSDDLSTVWNKLRVEGVVDFAIAPGLNQNVAVFVPERKVSIPDYIIYPAHVLTIPIGPTCCCQGLQHPVVQQPNLAKDLLQGRQGATEVECTGDGVDCVGANRRG